MTGATHVLAPADQLSPTLKTPEAFDSQVPAVSRQGGVVPFTFIEGPDAWVASDYKDNAKWIYTLQPEDIVELDAAVAHAEATGKPIHELTKDDFPFPTLAEKLVQWREEARAGRGFQVIRGVPVDRYTRKQSITAYWGFGLYWGKASSQNKKGHLIGHIKDIGGDPNNPVTRIYTTRAAQPYHNDAADLVSLLCLKNARSGGLSSISSSVAVHNEILRRAPELARLFAGPWYMDRKNEIPEGKKGYFMLPVFNYYKGYLSINYSDNYYFLSQRWPEVPRLTEDHLRAIRLFNELAASDALRLDMLLQPGDIQLLSNHTVLHTRSAYEDWEEIEKKRHLLRLWLAPENDRPLAPEYAELYGTVEVGNRGGIICPGVDGNPIPLEAE